MLKYFKKNKGFTLIELLVVIAIIAVLASIVLVSLNTARQKGRDARRIADLKSIQAALELYYDKYGYYPTGSGADLYADAGSLGKLRVEGFLPGVPKDPLATNYFYTASDVFANSPTAYHLGALMEGISVSQGALASDVDFDSNVWPAPASAGSGTKFPGSDADCAGASGSGDDKCYDVKN